MVNEGPVAFFKASRGIRQGCPLSPFLFLLDAKALNLLVRKAKEEENCRCQNFFRGDSYFIFVDDILLFGFGSGEEWKGFFEIISLFCLDRDGS